MSYAFLQSLILFQWSTIYDQWCIEHGYIFVDDELSKTWMYRKTLCRFVTTVIRYNGQCSVGDVVTSHYYSSVDCVKRKRWNMIIIIIILWDGFRELIFSHPQ